MNGEIVWSFATPTLARMSGSTLYLNMGVDAAAGFRFACVESIAESGNKMHRRFCPNCGVHMFSEAEERPSIIVIRAGTFDDTEQIKTEGIIWTSEAPSWAYLNPNVPHFENQPPAPQVNDDVS